MILWRTHLGRTTSSVPQPKLAQQPGAGNIIIGNFTDDQLLALFPKGSCIIAEVDGQTRFIVLDQKLAAQGLALQ